jgi:hypothetical protein
MTKSDRIRAKFIRKVILKWRKILLLDPIWLISIDIVETEIMDRAFARVDTSNAEYFVATLEISDSLLQLEDKEFEFVINEVACHELIHLVMIDFVRSAQLVAGNNKKMCDELQFKYEQFTSRFQRAFMGVDEYIEKLEELVENKNLQLQSLRNGENK